GHGLVWNPPPFRPVEGCTSFLWAVLLWLTWSVAGVEPPVAANGWSLVCGLVTFGAIARAALRRGRDGARAGGELAAFAVLAAMVTNRTFLSWLSSGLETALFQALFTLWFVTALRPAAAQGEAWLCRWSLLAALAALARPDGLLCALATAAVLGARL